MESKIQMYQTSSNTEIEVMLDKDTIWLDARLIAKLFNVQRPAIVKHINNLYKSVELSRASTCSIMEQVASAIVDRVLHHCHLLLFPGQSNRIKESGLGK